MADFASENAMEVAPSSNEGGDADIAEGARSTTNHRMDLLMTAGTHHRKFELEYEVTKNLAYYPVNVSSS